MERLWTMVAWIVLGLVLGILARLIVPGRRAMTLLATIVLGILGAFLGGLAAALIFGEIALGNPAGWIGAVIGAAILLLLFVRFAQKSRRT